MKCTPAAREATTGGKLEELILVRPRHGAIGVGAAAATIGHLRGARAAAAIPGGTLGEPFLARPCPAAIAIGAAAATTGRRPIAKGVSGGVGVSAAKTGGTLGSATNGGTPDEPFLDRPRSTVREVGVSALLVLHVSCFFCYENFYLSQILF